MAQWVVTTETGDFVMTLPSSYRSAFLIAQERPDFIRLAPDILSEPYPSGKVVIRMKGIQEVIDCLPQYMAWVPYISFPAQGIVTNRMIFSNRELGLFFTKECPSLKVCQEQLIARHSYLKNKVYPDLRSEFLQALTGLGITESQYFSQGSSWYSRRHLYQIE